MTDSRNPLNFDCEDPRALRHQATCETEQSRCRKYIRFCSISAALAGAVTIAFLALGHLVQHALLGSAMQTHGQEIAKGAFLLQPASPMLARTQRVPQLTLNTRSPSIPSISRVPASSGRPTFPSFDLRRPYTVPSRAVMPSMSSVTEKINENLFDIVKYLVIFAMIFLVGIFVVVDSYDIPTTSSMVPTFEVGDFYFTDNVFFTEKLWKRWRDIERRDVIVFNPPPAFYEFTGEQGELVLLKRVVAVEGDVVEVKDDGRLYINGVMQDEPFTNGFAEYIYGPRTVPPGCVFVLGDNRNESADGHVWGFLPKDDILGRATFRYWPPQRIGPIS